MKRTGFRKTKYGNIKSARGDSKAEARYRTHLELREKAGDIKDLQCQVRVNLYIRNRHMRVDFAYYDNHLDCQVWNEYKGFPTEAWKIKRDIWAAGFGPGLYRVTEWKRGGFYHTDIYPACKPETFARIIVAAHRSLTDEQFGQIVAGHWKEGTK